MLLPLQYCFCFTSLLVIFHILTTKNHATIMPYNLPTSPRISPYFSTHPILSNLLPLPYIPPSTLFTIPSLILILSMTAPISISPTFSFLRPNHFYYFPTFPSRTSSNPLPFIPFHAYLRFQTSPARYSALLFLTLFSLHLLHSLIILLLHHFPYLSTKQFPSSSTPSYTFSTRPILISPNFPSEEIRTTNGHPTEVIRVSA